ncbi:ribosomal protein L29 [Segatella baroniae F0067]|uniref:Large ribosomal subunit protein uL29 n=1 Tax=Segatella baroniae F0067 TaxID=1115809 RepID=U2QLL4_9BACT|nr:50S ribosomal protein L29 [Segatella baroniae]ERK39692.1 ribosomal protein L29 [Segatella baroniae F0067]
MKSKEIKELETKDLVEKLELTQEKLTRMKLNHAIAPLENPSQIKATRRDIARMKTELRQRELNK